MSFVQDTMDHRNEVNSLLLRLGRELANRGRWHDYSKFSEEEVRVFSDVLNRKASTKYGTPEYDELKAKLGPALEHHYKENRHHPEHWENGVSDMTLIDIIEMLADWKAATLRHPDDRIEDSIEINSKKYNIDKQLKQILLNTIKELR